MNVINSLHASHLLYKIDNTNFYENYTLLNEIAKGSNSTIFLSKDSRGEIVAVKRYAISDEKIITLIEQNGSCVDAYIKELAQKEREIGQLTDHPNIVKIREVFFENSTAYVVMSYVEGKKSDRFEKYPFETRVILMQQLLSAIEHFLLRNIMIDDLRPGNILISHDGTRLTLMDLGRSKRIHHNAEMPLGHYLEMIENMLISFGDEAVKALDNCKHLLPTTLREETLRPAHVRVLISWVEAMQKELSTPLNSNHTFSEDSTDKILAAHAQLQSQYPCHISFNTAQHSKFLAYSLMAAHVLKKFSPGKCSDSYLQNTHVLRYPYEDLPKSLEDLFQLLPIRDDYDTASSLVGDALISVSPSLNEAESEESAWAIFENNERKGDVADYINQFLESEKISPVHYRKRIKSVVQEAPKSSKGLIYSFFIPKDSPLYKAVYLSQPYGIPIGDPLSKSNVLHFYEEYQQGLVEEKTRNCASCHQL